MDLDRMLIEQIRNYPLLYDVKLEDYKSLRKKQKAWNIIAIHLNLSETQCRKRWKGLRDCYKRCKRNEYIAKKDGTPLPKRSWKYYNAMSFIDGDKDLTSYFEEADPLNSTLSFCDIEKKPLNMSMSTDSDSEPQAIGSVKQNKIQSTLMENVLMENGNLDQQFSKFLSDASATFSDTCTVMLNSKKNSTAVYFASLANKIIEAQLPPDIVNRIEGKVSNLIFTELDQYYHDMKMTSLI